MDSAYKHTELVLSTACQPRYGSENSHCSSCFIQTDLLMKTRGPEYSLFGKLRKCRGRWINEERGLGVLLRNTCWSKMENQSTRNRYKAKNVCVNSLRKVRVTQHRFGLEEAGLSNQHVVYHKLPHRYMTIIKLIKVKKKKKPIIIK